MDTVAYGAYRRAIIEQAGGLDPEFVRNTIDAQLCVDRIVHTTGYCNEGVARMMGLYQEALAKVPQRA